MDIIVLCGGLSAERDVSFSSGTMAAAALRRLGHRAVLVDLFFGYTGSYSDPKEIFEHAGDGDAAVIGEAAPDLEAIRAARGGGDSHMGANILEICAAADIVFIALHGADGEDGRIQATFDMAGIKYTGSGHLCSALAMDKGMAKQLFMQNGILTPQGITVKRGSGVYENVGFPCVVKPRSGGSSVGTSIVESPEGYGAALEEAFKYDEYVIVESFVKGRECDVGVLAGRALPPIEICPKNGFYDYKNKYQKGMADEYCPADFSEEVTRKLKEAAVAVYNALMFEVYGRMDFIVDSQNRVWCLEGNTLPGLTPTSLMPQEAAADGISYDELCQIIIDESLRKYVK